MSWLFTYAAVGWVIRVGMIGAVLRRNFAPGAAIAWLGIVFLHPYVGLALYGVFGESRLGPGRVAHHDRLRARYAVADPRAALPPGTPDGAAALSRVAAKVGRMPVVAGSTVELLTESATTVGRLADDIGAATSHVHLLYYLLAGDATGQRVAAALKAAAGRGVTCRVLLDGFASRAAFRRHGLATDLRAAGVEVAAALPSSPLRRRDLRNHRKLSVIDDRVAYAGSQNLIDPDYGGKRGGPWVDLSGRYTGPVVAELAAVFATDWAFETNRELDVPAPAGLPAAAGGLPMQVVPTGPTSAGESFRRLFIGAVNAAERRLVLTTPYFIPDEATLVALQSAADRGVAVSLIVPERSDNPLTAAAGRATYTRLLRAGVSVFRYRPGLIHTKLVTVDDAVTAFGSANLDVRSFHLNFELSTLLFGPEVVGRFHAVQQAYLADSDRLDAAAWAGRPIVPRYFGSAVSLISPLL